ncbi:LysR family transcriptional regulator [Variovorax sp. J22G73]|uniref:LysR family transcriptional regulator n=1 Tax=unclassified Variovorax TaxID=663243 RepID=UPI000D5C82FF|nr:MULTISPECIES: LysR family transcriptional regulator [unclassified Variovorax]MDM0007597.1 LysR family transcriptional regulator [Variovorax sp. J22R203]MDM0100043.1 LysR family transcriptional regulator [Variovorax sp. J22G73]
MKPQNIEALWTHLHWLTVLAQQGSFTAAALRLGVSKAAMSQRIAELERAAEAPLVQRTTRSVRLTEAGQRLVEDMRGPFEQIAHSFAGVRDLAGVPRGLVRVTAPVAFARQQLVPRLADFLRAHPEIRIELDLSDRLSSLAMEGFDLAIRHTAAPPDTHVAWTLCETRSLLVASRAYLRRRGTPREPQALAGHDCLHYPRAQDTPTWHFEARKPSPKTTGRSTGKSAGKATSKPTAPRITVPVSGPLVANNSEALRDAAATGLGIALVPDFSAQSALQSGKLVEVLPQWRSVGAFGERLYAIRPYATHVPQAVTAFVGWLRATLADGFAA